jgi:hypothetical protein
MAKASVTETRRVRYEDDLYGWTLAPTRPMMC